jgi:hypothetical protein
MMTDYSIIITRRPMDILRMSDFDLIESCHSLEGARREGGEYEYCALKSAKEGEILAFIVETQDLQEVDDLQEDEIFEDDERSVPGIEPVGRVRVRRFKKKYQSFSGNQYDLAVPERSTYGTDIPGFYEKVREWALETQKDKWEEAIGEDGKISADYLRDFVMKGGHYRDTQPRDMFGRLFAEYDGKESFQWASGGDWEGDESEEIEQVRGNQRPQELIEMAEDYEYRCDYTERNLSLDHSHVSYQIVNQEWEEWNNDTDPYEGEENEPRVRMDGSMTLEVDLDGPDADEFPMNWSEKHAIARDVMGNMNFSNEIADYDIQENSVGEVEFRVEFEIGYIDPSPTGFEEFCSGVQNDDEEYEKHVAAFRAKLVELGFAKPSRIDKLRAQIESKEIEFDNFTLTYDNEGGYNLIYPMEDEVFLIGPTTGDIRGVLGVTYGDTRDLRGVGNSFYSPKFKTDVLNQLTKYFVRAAQETNKQLQMDLGPPEEWAATKRAGTRSYLEEGEESALAQRVAARRASRTVGRESNMAAQEERFHANYPAVKPEEIREYIADGFVLGLERLRYTSAGTGGSTEREMKVGESRKARVTVLRFVLEDDAPEGFPDDQADELMLAAVKFVQFLDKDIEQLRAAINGVLQTADQKVSGQIVAADEELANMFEQLKVMHATVLAEIDRLREQSQSDRPARSAQDMQKWEDVRHLIDDLIIDIAASKKPQTILRYISDFRFTYQTRFKAIKDKVNQIETVEELSQLFEETNLERFIREEVETLLYG